MTHYIEQRLLDVWYEAVKEQQELEDHIKDMDMADRDVGSYRAAYLDGRAAALREAVALIRSLTPDRPDEEPTP